MSVTIKDPIHSFITVPPLCELFLDTVEFNRLRNIKQLGLAYYVYPSATHTRFEHSLGVMHLAGRVCNQLGVTGRIAELVQLAGLYHDIGHVAFSHLADYIFEEKGWPAELADHEKRSIQLLKKVNNQVGKPLSENELDIVSNMILGIIPNGNMDFLYQIIHNKKWGLDVDRLDYLQRDLYHLNMPCFQSDYLIGCLRIHNNRLTLQRKAQADLEMMYQARKRLLSLVCRHRTVIKAETLIRTGLTELQVSMEDFEKNWLKWTDAYIWTELEKTMPDLLAKLATRTWPDINLDNRFEHLHTITAEEIQKQLDKVEWSED